MDGLRPRIAAGCGAQAANDTPRPGNAVRQAS